MIILFFFLIHQINVHIATAADIAAWSEGNGFDGTCEKIRFSFNKLNSSGLTLSIKNCKIILKSRKKDINRSYLCINMFFNNSINIIYYQK